MDWLDRGADPDDYEVETHNRCDCGAFLPWKPTSEEHHEAEFGTIVFVTAWDCKRCGIGRQEEHYTSQRAYGPLPPWSDPYAVRLPDGTWGDALAIEAQERWADDSYDELPF